MESKKRIDELNLEENQQKNQIKLLEEIMKDGKFSSEEFINILGQLKDNNDIIYQKYINENSKILINSEKERIELLNIVLDGKKIGIILGIIKDNPELKQKILENLSGENCVLTLDYFDYYKNEKYAEKILMKVAENAPSLIFIYFSQIKKEDYIINILKNISENNPYIIFNNFKLLKNEKYAEEILEKAAIKEPFTFLNYVELNGNILFLDKIIKKIQTKEVLEKAAIESPFLFLDYVDKYGESSFTKDILKKIKNEKILKKDLLNKIDLAVNYFDFYKDEVYAKDFLLIIAQKNPFYIYKIFDKFKNKPYSKEILEKTVEKNGLYFFEFAKDLKKIPYIKEVLDRASLILSKDGSILKSEFQHIARIINDAHEENDETRFMIISKFDENKLYKLVYMGREEVFTSTYNGIISRLFIKLKDSGKDIYDLALENNFEGINIFIEARATYNKLDLLFNNIKTLEKKKLLIDKILDEERISANLPDYVAILEIIQKNKNEELEKYIFDKINNNIKNGKNKEYWLIIAKESNKINKKFFTDIPDEYSFSNLETIKNSLLFDENGKNIQQYYFYDDEDGKSSFQSFISNYKKSSDWKIEDKGSFVIIKSKENNKKQIEIYANKPEIESGSDHIKSYFAREFIVPQVVVHRGHSYHHAADTIKEIQEDVKMVFLGSCGGFHNVEEVLKKSPTSQIISTKGTGTKFVNEPLFKEINEMILNGSDINWETLWQKMSKQLANNKNFGDYIRPDQNLSLLFSKKLEELKKEGK